MSPLELRGLRRQLDNLLKHGLIEPTSSQYGTSVLFVKSPVANPDDPPKLRMVCDYRSVNKATISQRIPVPRIDECLEQLDGAQYFSSIDLQSGFHQQRLTDSDSDKTTITTRYGQSFMEGHSLWIKELWGSVYEDDERCIKRIY